MKFALHFALAMGFVAAPAHAAFRTGMSFAQMQAEINVQLAQNLSAQTIAGNARTAGVDAASVIAAMLNVGIPADVLTTASILAGSNSSTVISAAITAGGDKGLVTYGAQSAGVPQSIITAAIDIAGPAGGGGPFGGGSPPSNTVIITGRQVINDSTASNAPVSVTGVLATLGGTGNSSGPTAIVHGGRFAPGVNTIGPNANFGAAGTFNAGTSGGLVLNVGNTPGGAYLDFDLTSSAAGVNDSINTAGLALGNGIVFTFNAVGVSLLDVTVPYTLIATSGAVTGFNPTNISTVFLGSLAGRYTATYFVNPSNDLVVLFAVPEPWAWPVAVGGASLLLCLQRARRRLLPGSEDRNA
jgi:hypothetical protein